MNEVTWVQHIASAVSAQQSFSQVGLSLRTGLKLAYGCEIQSYGPEPLPQSISFETDLAIIETIGEASWKPRVVVEAKLGSITTHDAITYSQKASSHRAVHPYLRYGIILGNREHYPLPGRLYRHGAQFDFMISFRGTDPDESEMAMFIELLQAEVTASRTLEKDIVRESPKGPRSLHPVASATSSEIARLQKKPTTAGCRPLSLSTALATPSECSHPPHQLPRSRPRPDGCGSFWGRS